MRECLEYVVSSGTGKNGQVTGYRIGGKTGTADKGNTGDVVVSFLCFAPADDPQIAIGISIEYGGYGARIGDLVVDIANAYFALKDGSLAQQAEAEKEAEQAQQEDQAQTTDPAQAAAGQTTGNAAAQPAQMTPAADTAAPETAAEGEAQPAVQDEQQPAADTEQNPDAIAPEN